MRLIPINDIFIKIDDQDYEKCIKIKWSLLNGYATSSKYGLLHRFIMNATKNENPIDHINGDKLDNQTNNLRFATISQNNQNKLKRENCSSKYIGVSYMKQNKNWMCRINKKAKSFNDELHAAYWYDIQALEHYGSNAKTNNVERPRDFVDPIIKTEKILPTGVYMCKDKYYYSTIGEKYLGMFKKIEDAANAYNEYKKKLKIEKELKIFSCNITRNCDKVAIIKTTKEEEILTDDDKYHELLKYSWYINPDGYASTTINGKNITMHRFLINAVEGDIIDHINRNRTDNRMSNLRKTNETLNNHNKSKKLNSSSKYHGVCLEKSGKYRSYISCDRTRYYLGSFKTEESAANSYDKKAIELYGLNANLNFPEQKCSYLCEILDDYVFGILTIIF